MRSLAMPLVVCLAASALAAAPAAAAMRFHFDLQKVSATDSAPAELTVKAREVLGEILAERPEHAAAPGKGVKAYGVTLHIDSFERALAPNPKAGASGQVLTIRLSVQLVGSTIPAGVMALAGSGRSTVMAEVGATLRPREEELTIDDALRDALTHAVEEAVTRLSEPPAKVETKKKARKPKKGR